MKRILSMLLAVVMVLSTTVMAAPFQVSTVETAKEVVSEDNGADAKLSGELVVKPGINMLTGTAEPFTADEANATDILSFFKPGNKSNSKLEIAPRYDDASNKALKWTVLAGTDSNYYSYYWDLPQSIEALVGHSYIHYKFDQARTADIKEGDRYQSVDFAWLMHTDGSADNVYQTANLLENKGFKNFDYLLNVFAKTQGSSSTGSKVAKHFTFQVEVRNKVTDKYAGNSVDTVFYFDNFSITPAYKFEFRTSDGATLLDTKYQAYGDDGKVITSYKPEPGLYGAYYVPAWTTVKGGNAVESVKLNNENVVFYAASMIPAVTINQDGALAYVGATAKLTPSVASVLKGEIEVIKGNWAIEDENVATVVKNKDGSATVTAVGGGKTKAIFTVGNISTEYEIEVVLPLSLDVTDIKQTAAYEGFNPADYTAMLITLSDATVGESYTLMYQIGEGYGEVEIVATSEDKRDYYIDLTKLSAWGSANDCYLCFSGDATVEAVKLYSYFDAGFSLDINAESQYLTKPGEEVVVSVDFKSSLEGTYDESYELTITDENDVVSTKVYDDGTALIRAKVGTGLVTVTATSNEDPAYSVSKDIYVNVDPAKYGMYYDFLEATSLEDARIHVLKSNGVGHTDVSIKDGMLHLERPTTADGTGGFMHTDNFAVPATQKYLVVRSTQETAFQSFYYKWDANNHAAANQVRPTDSGCGTTMHDDGTKTTVLYMANVPDTANCITGYMGSIAKQTEGDILYFYTTSDEPEFQAANTELWKWDFSTNTFTASQNQLLTQFNGETMKATKAYAMLNGTETAIQVEKYDKLADGTEIIRISTNNSGNHGSLSPVKLPSNTLLGDYQYFWFKYRSNAQGTMKLYLKDDDAGGNESGWDSHHITFPKSEEWTTMVVYLPDAGFGASFNTKFNGMMFPCQIKTVLTNVQEDDQGYYVPKNYEYTKNEWIEFDEITIANYDPFDDSVKEIPLEMAVTVTGTATEITEDGGEATFTANIYANQEISTKDVTWTVDNGNVTVRKNDDGTLTVKAVSNGNVTITATAVEDPDFNGSITLKVSGQRNKVAAYDFNYLAIGNSYCKHGYNKNYSIWMAVDQPLRGMAASEPDLDYFHRTQYHILQTLNGTMKADRIASSGTENVSENETTAEAAKAKLLAEENFNNIKNYIIDEKPNLITVQLSENFGGSGIVEKTFYDVLYGMIDEVRPVNSVVVVITPFNAGTRVNVIKEYAAKYGFYVADMSDINSYSKVPDKSSPEYNTYIDAVHPETGEMTRFYRGDAAWKYNPYLAWAQYPAYDVYKTAGSPYQDDRAEFRTHPGDLGMDEIGKRAAAQFVKAIPAYLEAEYIYVPTGFEITGGNEITTVHGTLDLTATPLEDDAANDVIWSVSNEKFATIDENGTLTAKLNGKVTVKATSAYDSSVYTEIEVTITGQADVYTLTYAAGTDDEVKGLPANDDFATGEYTLSTIVPERNGYKFLGWSLTKNGETVKTVNVTSATTVYAVWTLADGWHFDEDDNDEGISFGGFNVVVKNGIGTVLSYDEGVSISDNTLKLNSDNYVGFNVRMDLSGTEEENLKLALEITTDNGKYSYSKDISAVGEQIFYSFDISDVEGTITGFAIKPSAMMCQANVDWIEFVRTSLDEDAKSEKVTVVSDYTINAGGYTYEIGTLEVGEGCTVTLVNGNFEVANVIGEGNIVTNGNFIYTGAQALEGYVDFETGVDVPYAHPTFAEVDGYQYKFNGEKYGLIVPEGETKLVQIVEKHADNSLTTLSSKYFAVNADGATELEVLEDSIDNEEEVSLRYKDPVGVRFKAGIVNTAKADVSVKEYGFVIALERDLINAKEQLTLDFNKVATGSAYISGTDTDVIFENDGTTSFFTGVLYGIPENSYGVKLVSKTFMKVEVDGEEFVVYGEPVAASAYEIAKSLEDSDELTDEAKAIVNEIIEKSENGKDVGFDYGDLF